MNKTDANVFTLKNDDSQSSLRSREAPIVSTMERTYRKRGKTTVPAARERVIDSLQEVTEIAKMVKDGNFMVKPNRFDLMKPM